MAANKCLEALNELLDRLKHELESTVGPDRKGALNVAIRGLISAIDIKETLVVYEEGTPQMRIHRDLDPDDQREEYLKRFMSPIEPKYRHRVPASTPVTSRSLEADLPTMA